MHKSIEMDLWGYQIQCMASWNFASETAFVSK